MSKSAVDDMEDLFGCDDNDVVTDVERDPTCGVLQFHDGTEESLFVHLRQHAIAGNIESLLKETDLFCYQRHWMMHIGDQKRQVIEQAFIEAKSTFEKNKTSSGTRFIAVEFGSYCGYSAIVFAQHLDAAKGDHLYCLEAHPKCVTYTRRMIELAQVSDVVTVLPYPASDVSSWLPHLALPSASSSSASSSASFSALIHFLFLDHDKNSYFPDIQAVVSAGLLAPQATVVADNVLCLNRPLTSYLDFVRDKATEVPVFQSSRLVEGYLEYTTSEERHRDASAELIDGIEISIFR